LSHVAQTTGKSRPSRAQPANKQEPQTIVFEDIPALEARLDSLERRVAALEETPPVELPVEPLFSLDVAAALIPMSYDALRAFLSRNKAEFPARYIRQGSGHRRVRLLLASEIRTIRERTLLTMIQRLKPRRS
jgi:hypothetical protein